METYETQVSGLGMLYTDHRLREGSSRLAFWLKITFHLHVLYENTAD